MTDSKLLDIVEDIKNLSTSGNKIQVEEYKNGKKVKKSPGPKSPEPKSPGPTRPRTGQAAKKKKLPIYVITNGSTEGYKIILTNPKKKKDYPKIGIDY